MKDWVQIGTAYVRLRDVSAFDMHDSYKEDRLLVYLRNGVTLRGQDEDYDKLLDAFGIASAERAEHGVFE